MKKYLNLEIKNVRIRCTRIRWCREGARTRKDYSREAIDY
jgi:hypothetical protein